MGQTGHGQISCKLNVYQRNSKDKLYSKGIKTNTELIEYFTKTLVKNK